VSNFCSSAERCLVFKVLQLLAFILVLSFFSPGNLQAQNAGVVCTDSARILLEGSRTTLNSAPGARALDALTINWSTESGHRGVCRVDGQGRVYAVEVTQFPAVSTNPYTLDCTSQSYRRKDCAMKSPGTAVLDRQLSKSQCTRDQTWGVNNASLWVDKGCSGRFIITPFPAWAPYTTNCESNKNRRVECRLKGPAEVRLTRQLSTSSCSKGTSWGVQSDVLWVDRGCHATFQVSPATVQAPGFADPRETAALQACSALTRGLGFSVQGQRVTQLGNRNVDVKVNAERNSIKVDLLCRYDLASKQAQFFSE
jgi:hypothetical protein